MKRTYWLAPMLAFFAFSCGEPDEKDSFELKSVREITAHMHCAPRRGSGDEDIYLVRCKNPRFYGYYGLYDPGTFEFASKQDILKGNICQPPQLVVSNPEGLFVSPKDEEKACFLSHGETIKTVDIGPLYKSEEHDNYYRYSDLKNGIREVTIAKEDQHKSCNMAKILVPQSDVRYIFKSTGDEYIFRDSYPLPVEARHSVPDYNDRFPYPLERKCLRGDY